MDTIKQLRRSIAKHCGLAAPSPASLQLFLGGFALLLASSTTVLREDDLVTVTTGGGALLPALEPAASLVQPAPAAKGPKKRAAPAAQPAADSAAQPVKKRRVASTPAKPAAQPAAPQATAVPSSSGTSTSADSSSEGRGLPSDS